jgi:hypothetical protein
VLLEKRSAPPVAIVLATNGTPRFFFTFPITVFLPFLGVGVAQPTDSLAVNDRTPLIAFQTL